MKELLERLRKAGVEITKVIEGFENENGNPKEYSPEKLLEISQEVPVSVERSRVLASMIITSAEVEGKKIKVRFIKTDGQQTSRDDHLYGISYSPNQGKIVLFISPNARNHQAALAECALNEYFFTKAREHESDIWEEQEKFFSELAEEGEFEIPIAEKLQFWTRLETGSGPLVFNLAYSEPQKGNVTIEMRIDQQNSEKEVEEIAKKVLSEIAKQIKEDIGLDKEPNQIIIKTGSNKT